jgi:hypothetical protein
MAASSSENWKPGKPVLLWAWTSTLVLISGAWIGAIFVFVVPAIAGAVLVLALPILFFALFRFWLEVGRAEEIPATIRRRLRQNVLLFGPVAVLQLLIYSRFPDSGFSGLRVPNE